MQRSMRYSMESELSRRMVLWIGTCTRACKLRMGMVGRIVRIGPSRVLDKK